jgi:hypothetical protein
MDVKLQEPAYWANLGFKPFDFHELRPEVPRDLEGWGFRHDMAKNVGVAVSPSNVMILSVGDAIPWKVMISKDAPRRMVSLIVRGVLGTFLEQATE